MRPDGFHSLFAVYRRLSFSRQRLELRSVVYWIDLGSYLCGNVPRRLKTSILTQLQVNLPFRNRFGVRLPWQRLTSFDLGPLSHQQKLFETQSLVLLDCPQPHQPAGADPAVGAGGRRLAVPAAAGKRQQLRRVRPSWRQLRPGGIMVAGCITTGGARSAASVAASGLGKRLSGWGQQQQQPAARRCGW